MIRLGVLLEHRAMTGNVSLQIDLRVSKECLCFYHPNLEVSERIEGANRLKTKPEIQQIRSRRVHLSTVGRHDCDIQRTKGFSGSMPLIQ